MAENVRVAWVVLFTALKWTLVAGLASNALPKLIVLWHTLH